MSTHVVFTYDHYKVQAQFAPSTHTPFSTTPSPHTQVELGLLCHLCSSRHLQMTQQLTHLLCKHTHSHAHTLQPPPAVPREAYAALKPCAVIQPVLIPCTSSTHSKPPQRLPHSSHPPGYVCPPICLSSDHSLPLLPSSHFHTSLRSNLNFSVLFQILYALHSGRLARR